MFCLVNIGCYDVDWFSHQTIICNNFVNEHCPDERFHIEIMPLFDQGERERERVKNTNHCENGNQSIDE